MKIFDRVEGWGCKVNFVDENNVVLGYDVSQHCCEHADWFISDYMITNDYSDLSGDSTIDVSNYRFDIDFFKRVDNPEREAESVVIFRITDGETEKFIHLYNIHNGYYSHGFTFEKNNILKDQGYL
jgi:hypothetical protein